MGVCAVSSSLAYSEPACKALSQIQGRKYTSFFNQQHGGLNICLEKGDPGAALILAIAA